MLRLLSAVKHSVSRRVPPPNVSHLSYLVTRKVDAEPPTEWYREGGLHPVSVGEVYQDQYRVVKRLGWGLYSTVWLVKDTKNQRFAAMKVLKGELTHDKTGWDEPGTLKELRTRNPQSTGYDHIVQLVDDFVVNGPNGEHISLIMEPMGSSVFELNRCVHPNMPMSLVKRISKHVLLALNYMHEECNMVHTDIKGENILMTGDLFPTAPEAKQLSIDELLSTTFKLADFGSTNRVTNRFAKLIQPTALRSPEVIIGAEWDTKADIWNFGCLVYEFARGAKLFDPFWANKENGLSPAETHLAQITGLLGPFPRNLLRRGKRTSQLFDEEGHMLRGEGFYSITLTDLLHRANHPPGDLPPTVDFLSRALTIDPDERWSAAQLLRHPWLSGVE